MSAKCRSHCGSLAHCAGDGVKAHAGCVSTGQEFVAKGETFRRVGPWFGCPGTVLYGRFWQIRRLPDAFGDTVEHCDQNKVMVQRKSDGCFCFLWCDVELDEWLATEEAR